MKVGDLVWTCGTGRYGIVMEIYPAGGAWGGGRSIMMARVFINGHSVSVPLSNLKMIS